jgi:hypothetical protein
MRVHTAIASGGAVTVLEERLALLGRRFQLVSLQLTLGVDENGRHEDQENDSSKSQRIQHIQESHRSLQGGLYMGKDCCYDSLGQSRRDPREAMCGAW